MTGTAQAAETRKRSFRWRRSLFLLAAFLLFLALAPAVAAPWVRHVIVREIERRIDARASIDDLSLSWGGSVRIAGLEISEPSGARLASLGQARLSLGLVGLLRGEYRAEVDLRDPELHLRRDPGGTWNLARLAREAGVKVEDEGGPKGMAGLPSIRARLDLSDGRVVFHGEGGETELSGIELFAEVNGLENPAPCRLTLAVRGPHGPAGGLFLEGTFTAAADGRLDVEGLLARARLELSDLDLQGLAPAMALFGPVQEPSGRVNGHAEFDLGRGLSLQGSTEINVREFSVRGPRTPAQPVHVKEIRLTGRATQESGGDGAQHLELRADDFLSLAYSGTSKLAPLGEGEISGALTLEGSLARLSEIANAWIPFQEGVSVEGRLSQRIDLFAGLRSRRPTVLRASVHGGIEGLGARDGAGRAIDLGELDTVELTLDASADLARGDLQVEKLLARAGPIALEGHLESTGLLGRGSPPEVAVGEGAFTLEADLERLRESLGKVVDLGGARFGGNLTATGKLGGEGGALVLESKIEARKLSFADLALDRSSGELKGRREPDGAFAATGTIRLERLALRGQGQPSVAIPDLGLDFNGEVDAQGNGKHSAELHTSDGTVRLVVRATSRLPRDAEGELAATFELEGSLASLSDVAQRWMPRQRGLSGDLRCRGELGAGLRAGELASGRSKVELVLSDLALREAGGGSVALKGLSRADLSFEAGLDLAQGLLDLRSLTIAAGSLHLRGAGRAVGLPMGTATRDRRFEIEDTRLELDADPSELGSALGEFLELGGLSLGGKPVRGEVSLSTQEGRLAAKGRFSSAELALVREGASPILQRDLEIAFDLGLDPGAGSLECRTLKLASQTATAEVSGSLQDLSDPPRARGKLELDLSGELGKVLADLGLEGPESSRSTGGRMAGTFTVQGDRGAFRVRGEAAIEGFRLELAPASEGVAPVRIEDPKIRLACDANVELQRMDLDLQNLRLESSIAHGGAKGRVLNLRSLGESTASDSTAEVRFEGLAGELAYVPDRLGPVLAPWLPGTLSGAEEQHVAFQLDGSARDLDLAAILAGTSGRADIGLGRFVRSEIELGGKTSIELRGGRTLVRGDLQANGGTLDVAGDLDLAGGTGGESSRSTLAIEAKDLRATAGLAPLLALVHPAFAGAEAQLSRGSLEGILGLSVNLSYDGPLSLEALESGWERLPKEPINGTGRFELRSAALRGSPLLALLEEFGVDTQRALDIRPVDFTVRRGRVSYSRPWIWTLSGVETTFTGSVGLDQTLDLAWNVPITDEIVKRFEFLGALRGELVQVPLRGTVRKPRLEVDDLLKDLAARAARKELESRLGLGGSKEDAGDDPAALLEEADRLWEKGKKAEAAVLYLRIRKEFALSVPYFRNRDRIKERSKYKEQ